MGCHEVLFYNERGEITEGSRTNISWKRMESSHPPLSCGLLDGVMRQLILRTEASRQRAVLTEADLLQADRIWVANAVRGLVEVHYAYSLPYPAPAKIRLPLPGADPRQFPGFGSQTYQSVRFLGSGA